MVLQLSPEGQTITQVNIRTERILRLLGSLLSQGNQYPLLWPQGPILSPQAVGTLTSLRCTPQSLSMRVKPFPLCLSRLWAFPCLQTEEWGPKEREELGESLGVSTRALGIKFFIH